MKKSFTVILVTVAMATTLALFGCTSGISKSQTDTTVSGSAADGAGEKPESGEKQVWLETVCTSLNERYTSYSYYDEYGNKVKTVKKDFEGNIRATWIYEYDGNNNLLKSSVITEGREPFVQMINKYDERGNLIERTDYTSERTSFYNYDEQNRLLSVSSNGKYVTEYSYDGQGRIKTISENGEVIFRYTYFEDGSYKSVNTLERNCYTVYNAEGKITEKNEDDCKQTYKYSDNGRTTEYAVYTDGELSSKLVYPLDENGNYTKCIRVFPDGTERVTLEFEFELFSVKTRP